MSNQLLLRRRTSCISDKGPNYLKFTALEDGCTLSLNKSGGPADHPTEYSLNKGAFMPYVFGTTINFDEGDTIEWRRAEGYESNTFCESNIRYYKFIVSGNINQDGLITSLLSIDENITSIGKAAFYNLIPASDGFIGSLTLQDSIVSIGENAFFGCAGLKGDLYIPDSVSNIGNNAFDGCKFDGSLHMSQNITTIPNRCFCNCPFTGKLNIPNTITTIGDGAFGSAKFSGDLEIPDSVINIGGSAFKGCTGFDGTLTLSENLESIGGAAFYNCSNIIGTVIIPDGVTSLPSTNRIYGQFNGCSKITKFVLPNNLTTIGTGVFYNVPSVVGTFVIPASLTSISSRAMDGLDGITNYIFLPTTPPSIGNDYPFKTKPIYVPYSADHSILNAYKTATNWGRYADYIYELDENGEIPS